MKTQMEKIPGIENTPAIYRNLSYNEIFEHEKKKRRNHGNGAGRDDCGHRNFHRSLAQR